MAALYRRASGLVFHGDLRVVQGSTLKPARRSGNSQRLRHQPGAMTFELNGKQYVAVGVRPGERTPNAYRVARCSSSSWPIESFDCAATAKEGFPRANEPGRKARPAKVAAAVSAGASLLAGRSHVLVLTARRSCFARIAIHRTRLVLKTCAGSSAATARRRQLFYFTVTHGRAEKGMWK